MIFKRTIDQKDFYINFYRSINFILSLSKKEIAILAFFANSLASLPKELTPNQQEAMAFSSANRKIIAEALGISIYNLNNYIKGLTDKGIFIKRSTNDGTRGLMLHPNLHISLPNIGEEYSNEIKFKIV